MDFFSYDSSIVFAVSSFWYSKYTQFRLFYTNSKIQRCLGVRYQIFELLTLEIPSCDANPHGSLWCVVGHGMKAHLKLMLPAELWLIKLFLIPQRTEHVFSFSLYEYHGSWWPCPLETSRASIVSFELTHSPSHLTSLQPVPLTLPLPLICHSFPSLPGLALDRIISMVF
jgi:hypothetical protein